jgi:hypothetical protein
MTRKLGSAENIALQVEFGCGAATTKIWFLKSQAGFWFSHH